jgi:tetratricopeptide (TPR) repeat protein
MSIKSLLFLLGCLLFSGINSVKADPFQENAAAIFARGNSEYQKGDYVSAERHYREIVDSGVDSGAVYYNLGNACFKQKRLGEAVYYWEKARQKLPFDREIRENLELVGLMLVDRIENPEDSLPLRMLSRIAGFLTIRQESGFLLILFIAANAFFSIYLLAKNPRYASRALLACFGTGILFVIFAGSLSWKIYERDFRKNAVVIEQRVDVRSGPGPENIVIFTIHEGIKVRVHESNNGWYQISLPNGWNGWLPQDNVRIL